MIKYLVAMLLACSSAFAADLPYRKAPVQQPVVVATDSWTGFYLGVHGGYGWADADPLIDISPFSNPKMKGWVFGGHAGYLWQYGMFVGGLEIDYSVTDLKHDQSIQISGLQPEPALVLAPIGGTATLNTKVDALASARARAGFVMGNTFYLYGTGGIAWARSQADVAFTPIEGRAIALSAVENHFGWVAGIGGEWRLMNNWMFRAEFLHYDFGETTYVFTGPFIGAAGVRSDLTVNVARGALSFKF